jgi:excisionase family DNA binding protein
MRVRLTAYPAIRLAGRLAAMSEEKNERKLFDIESCAAYLREIGGTGITAKTVYGLIASGKLKKEKIGKRYFIPKASIDKWLDRHDRRDG